MLQVYEQAIMIQFCKCLAESKPINIVKII